MVPGCDGRMLAAITTANGAGFAKLHCGDFRLHPSNLLVPEAENRGRLLTLALGRLRHRGYKQHCLLEALEDMIDRPLNQGDIGDL